MTPSEKRKAYSKAYYRQNREKAIANARRNALANKEKVRERQKRWRDANKAKRKTSNAKWQLKKLYGLTPEQRDQMFEAQGRVCKCCGSDDPKAINGWHVDHCHSTGLVRGILCQQCNIMLGCAADNPLTLLKGAEYLLLA